MRMRLWAACFAVLALQAVRGAAEPPPAAIRIGAVVSLTGDAAKNGLNWLEGAQLAVEDLNRAGIRCEMLVEDDASTPVKAATAFTKLADVDHAAAIVGGTWDFLAEAVFPYAARYRTPFISPTNPVEVLSQSARANPWIFVNGLSLAAAREAAAGFLDHRRPESIGTIAIDVPYGTLHAQMIRALAGERGIPIVFEQRIVYEGFHQLVRQAALVAAQKKPDLLMVVLNYEGVDLLLRELERLRVRPTVLMTHTLREALEYSDSPERYKDAYAILQRFEGADFTERFTKKFGRAPYGYAPPAYDAVQFLVRAIHRGLRLGESQEVFSYRGLTGTHSYPAPSRELTSPRAYVVRARGRELIAERWEQAACGKYCSQGAP